MLVDEDDNTVIGVFLKNLERMSEEKILAMMHACQRHPPSIMNQKMFLSIKHDYVKGMEDRQED